MFLKTARRRVITLGTLALFAGALAACKDKTAPEPEPEVDVMRITVGTQSVNVDASTGVCTGCPLVLSNDAVLNVVFLTDDGQPDLIVHSDDEFRVTVEVATNTVGLAFTASVPNPFGGMFTATGTTATPFNVTFGLLHISEGHEEFEWPVEVIVQ